MLRLWTRFGLFLPLWFQCLRRVKQSMGPAAVVRIMFTQRLHWELLRSVSDGAICAHEPHFRLHRCRQSANPQLWKQRVKGQSNGDREDHFLCFNFSWLSLHKCGSDGKRTSFDFMKAALRRKHNLEFVMCFVKNVLKRLKEKRWRCLALLFAELVLLFSQKSGVADLS